MTFKVKISHLFDAFLFNNIYAVWVWYFRCMAQFTIGPEYVDVSQGDGVLVHIICMIIRNKLVTYRGVNAKRFYLLCYIQSHSGPCPFYPLICCLYYIMFRIDTVSFGQRQILTIRFLQIQRKYSQSFNKYRKFIVTLDSPGARITT